MAGEDKEDRPGRGGSFMTAYSDTDKAVRAIKAGATDFIPKPWERRNYSLHSLLHWNFGRVGRKCEI